MIINKSGITIKNGGRGTFGVMGRPSKEYD